MNCERCEENFSDFIDGELSAEQAEGFRNHLRACKACRREFEKFRQAQTLLKLLPKKKAPAELWKTIQTEVKPAKKETVFFLQTYNAFEDFKHKMRRPLPDHVYGVSFRMLRRR